jgi:MGT family glycosyltransferase
MVGVGAHGHFHPHLPVIAELVARGHRVRFAVPTGFADAVATTGAEPLVVDSALPDPARGQHWPDGTAAGMRLFLDDAVGVLPQLAAALDADRPDLVLHDTVAWAGRALAHCWGLPHVQLSPFVVPWKGHDGGDADRLAFLDTPDPPRFDGWLRGLGIDLPATEFTGRPDRCVVLVPRAMQPHAELVDERVHAFVGPALDRRPHQGEWPAPDRPLLLVSLGSAYNDRVGFYRDCVAAFGGRGWQVVIVIGAHIDPAELGELPAGVELHRWVPQLAVLGRATAFVTHAGMGGCAEALHQGVPMVAVPQAVDQPGNAARLVELGVGVHLPPASVTPQALREAVDVLVGSPAVAARLAVLRAEQRAAGGAAAAADVVEAELAAR